MTCICGSNKNFEECCEAVILGKRDAVSPEELMRSRYTAYVLGNGAYLVKSSIKQNRHEEDIDLIEEFSKNVKWLKLEVLHVSQQELKGEVEFKAYYLENSDIVLLHERSEFEKHDGVWEYASGKFINSKIERNDPCPCGSGIKYKKCKQHLIAY
jgi:SEC-C motif-containing protein